MRDFKIAAGDLYRTRLATDVLLFRSDGRYAWIRLPSSVMFVYLGTKFERGKCKSYMLFNGEIASVIGILSNWWVERL